MVEDDSLNRIRGTNPPNAHRVSITRLNTTTTICWQVSVSRPRSDVLNEHIVCLNDDRTISNLNSGVWSRLSKHGKIRRLYRNSGQKIDVSANFKHAGTRTTRLHTGPQRARTGVIKVSHLVYRCIGRRCSPPRPRYRGRPEANSSREYG